MMKPKSYTAPQLHIFVESIIEYTTKSLSVGTHVGPEWLLRQMIAAFKSALNLFLHPTRASLLLLGYIYHDVLPPFCFNKK